MPSPHAISYRGHSIHDRHAELWRNPPKLAVWLIAVTLAGGLALDACFAQIGQLVASIWVFAVFGWLLVKGGKSERKALVACMVIAAFGEAFLSLAWGLYDYQFNNIPAFVPPGHALLMMLGVLLARQSPALLILIVPACALPYVAIGLWQGWDTLGAVLFLIFLACLLTGKAQSLYATMFILSLLLELYGTALGNWKWQPLVPWLGLSNTNPPLCSGAFYCVLDLLVLKSMQIRILPPSVRHRIHKQSQ